MHSDPAAFLHRVCADGVRLITRNGNDDVGIVWLQPNGQSDLQNAVTSLKSNAAAIHATVLPDGTIFTSNIVFGSCAFRNLR